MDPSKVQTMLDGPNSNTVTKLRGFLGLSGYYRKFIEGYGKIVGPLTGLLKNHQFGWNAQDDEAFKKIKLALTTSLVLQLPDFTQPFIIETDTSGVGLGAVLMQGTPGCVFQSGVGSPSKAVVLAIRKWRPYLLGRKFIVRTDRQSLKFLLEQRVIEPEYQRWVSKLLGYEFEIVYKPGSSNKAANALSRKLIAIECATMGGPQWRQWDELRAEVDGDAFLNRIKSEVQMKPDSHKGFELRQGILL